MFYKDTDVSLVFSCVISEQITHGKLQNKQDGPSSGNKLWWDMFLRWPNPEWTSMTFRPFDLLTLCTLGSSVLSVLYCTILYCTVLYHIVPYCGLDQYTPLVEVNQAIYAWSFRQKVLWWVVVVISVVIEFVIIIVIIIIIIQYSLSTLIILYY